MKTTSFPVIDIFAGPGGLAEGFSEYSTNRRQPFRVALSIEKDPIACKTLKLRKFFRSFRTVPDEYIAYLNGQISLDDLYVAYPAQETAAGGATWHAELGQESEKAVFDRVSSAIGPHHGEWILVGGPPCQAYSLVGRSRMRSTKPDFEDDKRHFLYREYLKIVAKSHPAVFVMENVRGILSSTHGGSGIFERIVRDLRSPAAALGILKHRGLSYRLYGLGAAGGREYLDGDDPVEHFLLRAERYGVPQARHRVFIVGVRSDVAGVPPPLEPSSALIKVSDVIADLPPIRSRLSTGGDSWETWIDAVRSVKAHAWMGAGATSDFSAVARRAREALRQLSNPLGVGGRMLTFGRRSPAPGGLGAWYRAGATGLTLHEARGHMKEDLHRYLFCASYADVTGRSATLRDFPVELRPRHKNVREAVDGNMFADRFRVQTADRPSSTVTSHMAKDGNYFIHYSAEQCRTLTVREAARLQTFPDSYQFCGNRTEQYHQVGNAVPPRLAMRVAASVHKVLRPNAGDL